MQDPDHTLTSPLQIAAQLGQPVLALTVLWHPDHTRIGAQCFMDRADGIIELSRYLPLFGKPGTESLALGYGGLSRLPLRIAREANGQVSVQPPASRMAVELNGVDISACTMLDAAQVGAGAVLGLGRAILLCIHWATCLPQQNAVAGMLGVGSAIIQVRKLIQSVAATDLPVLLLGETGCGKEVAARAIHALGRRAGRPLVAVNMAAMNESLAAADLFGAAKGAYTGAQAARTGYFGEAVDSTLFLDEIGNTPANVQPMLLRVLESGQYRPLGAAADAKSNARILAATDQDLHQRSFNQALLRRLESFVITIPPLRERREDIGVLIAHCLEHANGEQSGPDDASLPFEFLSACANWRWPGNVRQLEHVVRRAVLALRTGQVPQFAELVREQGAAPQVMPASAPPTVSKASTPAEAPPPARRRPAEVDDSEVLAAMHQSGWQILHAARALGISRPTMYKLIAAHPAIRQAEHIAPDELARTLAASNGDLARCAAHLLTPLEALRRRLRVLGLVG